MVSPPFIYKICQILGLVIKRSSFGKTITNNLKKETEDMDLNQYESNESFFWNLFLQTGRIDAYLLLKEEESETDKEKKA